MKKWRMLAAAAVMTVLLCGCGDTDANQTAPTELVVEQITFAQISVPISELGTQYPELKQADMTGCEDYAAIEDYIAAHPDVAVRYAVSLGNREFSPETEEITLMQDEYTYPAVMANLKYLRNLRRLRFEKTALLPDAIENLRKVYPDVKISYSVDFCGELYDGDTGTADFSMLEPESVLERGALLELLPKLAIIDLMDADGNTKFSLEQAAALQKLVPDALLYYSFELFGKVVSTTDEEITYVNQNIGNKEGSLDTLRLALSIMGGCERFVLDNCKFKNEDMAMVRDEFRGKTKLVWRIWFAQGGCLTDRQIIRYVYGLYDSNCTNLIYCEDAEFIDVGHNEYLKTCEFVSHMKKLRAIILSGSMIADLTPLANCESLEFLELAYCGYLEDISPLSQCTNLKRLNIAFTKVQDLSALDALPLEVMVDARSQTGEEERQRFDQLHPDCLIQHTGDAKEDQPYGYPWRYDEQGDPNEYYALISEKFHYPNAITTLY